jgi:subtilisin family serine protease
MNGSELPNPSFYVLTIPRPEDVEAADAAIGAQLQEEDGHVLAPLGGDRYVVARAPGKQLLLSHPPERIQAFLQGLPGVAAAEPAKADEIAAAFLERAPTADFGEPPAATARQWNLERVRAPQAWRMFPGGLRSRPWREVRIGHIDTGYTRHDVFGPWDGHRSPSLRPHLGINFREGGLPEDPGNYKGFPGHGTRTASVLTGYLPGTFFGVAPQVQVVPYRITNSVIIDAFDNPVELGPAIDHAVNEAGCQVISVSLGNPCLPRRAVTRAINRAYDLGVIIVAAAGNVTSEITYPARYTRTLAIAGSTPRDRPWTGSARGRLIDLAAPADDIMRAETRTGQTDRFKGKGDGTSYATVHVAGAAALWIAFHGNELERFRQGWQRIEAFRLTATRTARRPRSWDQALWGAGILDIAALLEAPLPDPADLTPRTMTAAAEVD